MDEFATAVAQRILLGLYSITMLVGLTGHAGAGKDTVADLLRAAHGGRKIAFAGPLKAACASLFRLTPDQLHDPVAKETLDPRWGRTPRQILQVVGTDLLRAQFDVDVFRKSARFGIEAALAAGETLVVVSDCRFENEAALVRELGGVVWHVRRATRGTTETAHVSEQTLAVAPSDVVVANDGTLDDLRARVLLLAAPVHATAGTPTATPFDFDELRRKHTNVGHHLRELQLHADTGNESQSCKTVRAATSQLAAMTRALAPVP